MTSLNKQAMLFYSHQALKNFHNVYLAADGEGFVLCESGDVRADLREFPNLLREIASKVKGKDYRETTDEDCGSIRFFSLETNERIITAEKD